MKWTNKHNLPERVIIQISKTYQPDPKRLSVTDLIGCPRERQLLIDRWDDVVMDYSDFLQTLLGISLHQRQEKLAENEQDIEAEVKFEDKVGLFTVVGKADNYDTKTGIIRDTKVKAVGVLQYESFLKDVEHQLNCYDKETEVLTREGWKKFADLDGTEEIYSLNTNNGTTFYQKPVAYQEYEYNGEMIHFLGKQIDLLVTPDHNMYWKPNTSENFILSSAREAYSYNRIKIKKDGMWKGIDPEFFYCPPVKEIPGKKIKKLGVWKMEDYVEFMGWYLSEGWILHSKKGQKTYRMGISQSKDKNAENCKQIEGLLTRLNIKWRPTKGGYSFSNKQLYFYLKQFGYSKDKHIPQEIKELSPRLLKIFIGSYEKGDGSRNGDGAQITTLSKNMADDLQEIIFKAGYSSTIENGGNPQKINKCYIVSRFESRDFDVLQKSNTEPYQGLVYDLSLPEYHVMLVRRKGIAVWSGNCYAWQRRKRGFDVNGLEVDIYYRDWQQWRSQKANTTSYAVMKKGRKTAVKIVTSEMEGWKWMKENTDHVPNMPSEYYIETRVGSGSYPLLPIDHSVPVPLWTFEQQEEYVNDKVELFTLDNMYCDEECRWRNDLRCKQYCKSRTVCDYALKLKGEQ